MNPDFWAGGEATSYTKSCNSHIEVFRTNITHYKQAVNLKRELLASCPYYKVNFDLEDCDKILRIESETLIDPSHISKIGDAINIHIVKLEG